MRCAHRVLALSVLALAACSGSSGPPLACAEDPGCTSLKVSGWIEKLVASPDGSLIYALHSDQPHSDLPFDVIVFDVVSRSEVARIPLPFPADDIDLSPNGQHLVVAHDEAHRISRIDPRTNALVATVPVASDPYRLEVNDDGTVYYIEYWEGYGLRRVDASLGSDTLLDWWISAGDLELSRDGAFLYAGQADGTGDELLKFDVSSGTFATVDRGGGFYFPPQGVYLSPNGAHAYYGWRQFDADRLAFISGWAGEIVAEDEAGTLALNRNVVRDARTLRQVGTLPVNVWCATFARHDTELWYYGGGDRLHWVAKSSLGDAWLGSRFLPPEPLSQYTLSTLVRDPARPRLYGIDAVRDLVVAIDSGTLRPVGAFVVGSDPTDLAISLDADALYVGHLNTLGVARIDLSTATFDRFIVVDRMPWQVETLAQGGLAIIDQQEGTRAAILDPATGSAPILPYLISAGALAATADGTSLFIGDSGSTTTRLRRFQVNSLTSVVLAAEAPFYCSPRREVLALPDGSGAFYCDRLVDGTDLGLVRYVQPDPIRTVTPDSRLAISSSRIYRVSDGASLAELPVTGSVQAISPDGATLYVATPGAITTVDLRAY